MVRQGESPAGAIYVKSGLRLSGMRVVVTGGSGFIGVAVVRRLVARGDRVVAIVRDPERAPALADLGVELRRGDLSRTMAIVDAMRGADAAIHLAGSYRVGIPASERPAMLDANVGATNRVLDAVADRRPRAHRLRLDRQHVRRHARPDRRREVPARPGRRAS